MNAKELWNRMASTFRRRPLDRDFEEEMSVHLDMAREDNLRLGMSPAEARRKAALSFGSLDSAKEGARDQRGFEWLDSLLKDLTYSLRVLGNNWGFTTVVVLTLALGIGANTAIFSVVNQVLLHPPGIANPERLIAVRERYDKLNLKSISVSPPTFADARDSRQIFEHAAAMRSLDLSYTGATIPERLRGAAVSVEWFDVFGAKPTLGRVFVPEEDQPGANLVAVLAHATWVRLYGADPAVLGRSIELSQQPYKIVGVMGPAFEWPRPVDLWVPLALPANSFLPRNRFNEDLEVVARMKPGATFSQAQTWFKVLTDRVWNAGNRGSTIARNGAWGMFGIPFTDFNAGNTKTPVLVLLGAVGLVLLIACSNIAGLMLARASARCHEMGVRAALGASRRRLLRQALVEAGLLAIAGAVAGLVLADGAMKVLIALAPESAVQGVDARLDMYVLLFTAAAAVASGLLFGIAPAWQMSKVEALETMKSGGRSSTASKARLHPRSVLVVAETALALVLLVGAGMFLRTFDRLQNVHPGFDAAGVMTATYSLPEKQYSDVNKVRTLYQTVLRRLTSAKGVTAASIGLGVPFSPFGSAGSFQVEGRAVAPDETGPHGGRRWVTPDYFKTLAIPLKRGRYFAETDHSSAPQVVIIDENLARQYWPGEDPLGKRIRPTSGRPEWFTIVGVVGHVLTSDLAADDGKGVVYFNLIQQQQAIPLGWILAKTFGDPSGLAAVIRDAVREADPKQPVHTVVTLDSLVSSSLASRRFVVWLLTIFAATALFMAALGLYGVISYAVKQSTKEIGIRVALGAGQRSVLFRVITRGLRLTALGVVLGFVGAFAIGEVLRGQLPEVSEFDPLIFTLMAAVLLAAAALASYLPARQAVRTDPLVALRYE